MEPLTAISIASNLVEVIDLSTKFISESLLLSYEASKLYDTTGSWKPLLRPGQNFLEIFDIPFLPGESARLLLKNINIHNIDDILKNLPIQEMYTVRIYFTENLSIPTERSPIATPSFVGSPEVISQWGLFSKKLPWETHSYKLSLKPMLKGAMLGSSEYSYIDSISIAAGTIRRTLRCMTTSIEDGRIICKYIHPHDIRNH
jgi:hypothetical protein